VAATANHHTNGFEDSPDRGEREREQDEDRQPAAGPPLHRAVRRRN